MLCNTPRLQGCRSMHGSTQPVCARAARPVLLHARAVARGSDIRQLKGSGRSQGKSHRTLVAHTHAAAKEMQELLLDLSGQQPDMSEQEQPAHKGGAAPWPQVDYSAAAPPDARLWLPRQQQVKEWLFMSPAVLRGFIPDKPVKDVTGPIKSDSGGNIPWAEFWSKLEGLIRKEPLLYVRFLYDAHHLDLPEKRKHFQAAVACCKDNPDVLNKHDITRILDAVGSDQLSDTIDFAMNMAWTEWCGGTGSNCKLGPPVLTPADQWITQWNVRTQSTAGGGSIVTFLQGKLSGCDKWLDPVQAGSSSSSSRQFPSAECLPGFTALNGVKRASGGLASFLGADDLSCPGAWHMSGAELSLDPPARVAGYQARIADKPAPHIDSVRFLFRSYAAPDPRTKLLPMVFISYRSKDEDAVSFARGLYSALRKAKVACFLNTKELHEGDPWQRVLRAFASRSKVFVPVLSANYLLDSPWCLAELHLAVKNLVNVEDVKAGARAVGAVIKGEKFSQDALLHPTEEQTKQWRTAWAALADKLAAAVDEPPAGAADWPAADLNKLFAHWQVREIEKYEAPAGSEESPSSAGKCTPSASKARVKHYRSAAAGSFAGWVKSKV